MTFALGPLSLIGERSTVALASRLSDRARPGDCFLLWGPIGAGKSAFARAFIRALTDPDQEVPSPTFTLVQTYHTSQCEIWHADLFRLSDPDEIIELGFDNAFETAITLIEWPERLGPATPGSALNLKLAAGDLAHTVSLTGPDQWAARLKGLTDGF